MCAWRIMSTNSENEPAPKRLVVAITGASGAWIGARLLEVLAEAGVETHLAISEWGAKTIAMETPFSLSRIEAAAHAVYDCRDMGAAISSGSFPVDGMIVAPCSMKTLSAIAHGYSDNLVSRAAEVTIKEGRRLALVPRETPLSPIHLRNMLALAELGVHMVPPVLSFYSNPETLAGAVDFIVGKLLDLFAIEHALFRRWDGK